MYHYTHQNLTEATKRWKLTKLLIYKKTVWVKIYKHVNKLKKLVWKKVKEKEKKKMSGVPEKDIIINIR